MKNVIKAVLLLVLLFGTVSCNNKSTSSNGAVDSNQEKGAVKVLAPEAMYKVLKDNPTAQLVDVRTDDEFKVSHLRDAQNICVTDSDFKQKVVALDKNKAVYVYCKKGGRSARAAKILQEMGFKEIYDLDGGITKWEKESLETEQ